MTMVLPEDPTNTVTLPEIARSLADFRHEFRNQIGSMMRADVYRAEQAAMDARVKRIEADREREDAERDSFRRLVFGAFASAGGTLVVALVMFLVTLANRK